MLGAGRVTGHHPGRVTTAHPPGADRGRMPRALGDRLEQAIEERAEVELEIERGEAERPPRRRLVRTAIWLVLTAVSLYLVFPSLADVFGSWRDLAKFGPAWLAGVAGPQTAPARRPVGPPHPPAPRRA